MTTKTETIKIEQTSCGYELTINEWFVNSFSKMETLLEYLDSRIRLDFT